MEDGNVNSGEPVKITAPPAGSVTIDPQNPLPDPSFMWRRVLTFLISLVLLGLAWHNAIQLHDLGDSDDLLSFAKWCIALNGFVLLCYFIGPSAAELTSIIQSARIIKGSINLAKEGTETKAAAPKRPRPVSKGQINDEAPVGRPAPPKGIPPKAPSSSHKAPPPSPDGGEIDFAPTARPSR